MWPARRGDVVSLQHGARGGGGLTDGTTEQNAKILYVQRLDLAG